MSDIRQLRAASDKLIREAEGAMVKARAGLVYVQTICTHPSATTHQTCHMGDLGTHWECPDCGKVKST